MALHLHLSLSSRPGLPEDDGGGAAADAVSELELIEIDEPVSGVRPHGR